MVDTKLTVAAWLRDIGIDDLEGPLKSDAINKLSDFEFIEDMEEYLPKTLAVLKTKPPVVQNMFKKKVEAVQAALKSAEEATKASKLGKLAAINKAKEELKKFQDEADAIRKAAAADCNDMQEQVGDEVKSMLKDLEERIGHENKLQLPPKVTRADVEKLLQQYTDSSKGVAASLSNGQDLDDEKLLDDHGVFQGFYLGSSEVTTCLTPCIRLKQGITPTSTLHKNHGKEYKYSSMMSSGRESSFKAAADKFGHTAAMSIESKGAAFVGSGVAGWSVAASVGSKTSGSANHSEAKSSSTTEYRMFASVWAPRANISLDPNNGIEFTEQVANRVAGLIACAAGPKADKKELEEMTETFLTDFGTHLPLEVVLGGTIIHNAQTSAQTSDEKDHTKDSLATALKCKVETGGVYAGVGGGGSAGAAVQGSADKANAKAGNREKASDSSSVTISTTSLGGGLGSVIDPNPGIFMKALIVNSNWGRIGSNPDHIMPIWKLLKKDEMLPVVSLKRNPKVSNLPDLEKLVAGVCDTMEAVWCQKVLGCEGVTKEEDAYNMISHRGSEASMQVTSATGGGVAWHAPTRMEENQLTNPGDRDYALQGVPGFLIGGLYVGSYTWPTGTGWTWSINFVPPVRLYIWAWGEHTPNSFHAGIHPILASSGWTKEQSNGFKRSDNYALEAWSKTFVTGSSIDIHGLSGLLVGGVVSQEAR